jgi:uncharacterized repeat protein (TIGR03803 family)
MDDMRRLSHRPMGRFLVRGPRRLARKRRALQPIADGLEARSLLTPTTLASFNSTDGASPYGNLTLSADRSTLYGMTSAGGADNDGVIFSIPVTGGTPTVLASFNGTDGASAYGSLTLSADGSTLYGVTSLGGADWTDAANPGFGTIFSIPVTGGTPTTLYSFNGTDTYSPQGSLALSGSTLYGMFGGGDADGDGVIVSIPVTGGTPTVLASFNGTDGSSPVGGLTLSGSTLYGMTSAGGTDDYGVIFSIPVTGGTPTTLLSFNGTDGFSPEGSLTLSGSTLYGMANRGGAGGKEGGGGDGVIFSIPVAGGTPTVLASFNGIDGQWPYGSLTLEGSTLYGMTNDGGTAPGPDGSYGTIFSIPVTGGTPTVLASFNGTDGGSPLGSLTLSADGSTLYGMTFQGGLYNDGVVFAQSVPATPAPPPAPTATTQPATLIESTGATLSASVDPEGSATTVSFVYGTTSTLSSGTTTTPGQPIGDGSAAVSVTAALTGLTAGTTYYYEVVATSAGGTTDGSISSFTTPTPAPTSPVVIGEQPVFHRQSNKKDKPVGNPVLAGFTLDFSVPLNPATAEDPANYQVDTVTTKKVKRSVKRALHAITKFTVSYLAASDAVELAFTGKETFPTGGQLTVVGGSSGGVTAASGAPLAADTVFTIAAGGRKIFLN